MSYSDGIFETSTKIVMTTNLKIDDTDEALMRPGRCFDTLNIVPLDFDYALNIWCNVLKLKESDFRKAKAFTGKSEIKQAELMSEAERVHKKKKGRKYVIDGSKVGSVAVKGEIKFRSTVGFQVPDKEGEPR